MSDYYTSMPKTVGSRRTVIVSVSAAGHKDITTTLNIYAEEFDGANAASVETISSCISIPSVTKTTEE